MSSSRLTMAVTIGRRAQEATEAVLFLISCGWIWWLQLIQNTCWMRNTVASCSWNHLLCSVVSWVVAVDRVLALMFGPWSSLLITHFAESLELFFHHSLLCAVVRNRFRLDVFKWWVLLHFLHYSVDGGLPIGVFLYQIGRWSFTERQNWPFVLISFGRFSTPLHETVLLVFSVFWCLHFR